MEGIPLVDAHVHLPRLSELKPWWWEWVRRRGESSLEKLYGPDGKPIPKLVDAYFADQGVDAVLLLPEYSPRTVGIHPYEDLLPPVEHNPKRFRFLANLNPHLHYPPVVHLERQLEAGAVGLKLHPVHGGFPPDHSELFPVYWLLEERGLPVVFHTGVSAFPGSVNAHASPEPIEAILRAFPRLKVVLAHGGRGWWYGVAATMALVYANVWIDLSGLNLRKLPEYFRGYALERIARKFIFGSDWPGVARVRESAMALGELGWDRAVLEGIFYRNACEVYGLEL